MIHSVEIKNLRGIREGKLEKLSPLTVLVGPNGCGKSTVLDAMFFGADSLPPRALAQTVLRRKGVREGARWLVWRADETRGVLVTLVDEDRGPYQRSFQFKTPEQNELARLFIQDSTSGYGHATASLIFSVTGEHAPKYDYKGNFSKVVPEVRLIAGYMDNGEPLHKLYSRTVEKGRRQQVKFVLGQLMPGFRDVEILTEGDTPILHLLFDEYSVPAVLAGDGIHALLRLVLELSALPQGLVLLEEPEVHQHPASVRQCARTIWATVRQGIQVVLTTHSLEFIDILLAEAEDDDLQKLSLFRLKLDDGRLLSSHLPGPDVAFSRQQIEDDLR